VRVFSSVDDFKQAIGSPLGASEWLAIDQGRIDNFADATGDHQWIHVDPGRAAGGPFGTTIAHGYLTLALGPALVQQLYRVEGSKLTVNYGLNRVRFITPVTVGSRVRVRSMVKDAVPLGGAVHVVLETTFEIEGADKPACVAETLARFYF
jgi:acyl dehydratase